MSSPPLLCLPLELHQNILSHLQLRDRARLAMTSRYFVSVASPKYEEFLADETSDRAILQELYTCKHCRRFRRAQDFANDMIRGRRAHREAAARNRFCTDCGVERGQYKVGTQIAIQGRTWELRQSRRSLTDHTTSAPAKPYWIEVQKLDSSEHRFNHEDWGVWSRIDDLCPEEMHAIGLSI